MQAPTGPTGVVAAARMEEEDGSNTGSPGGGGHTPTGTPRGAGRAARVADGLVLPRMPGNAGGGKEPWFESDTERKQGVTTGESLTGAEKVRKLQTVLHTKAKEEPDRRFHALIDKVWREDFLVEAWRRVRRNGGAPGVDAETFADIGSYGVERWLGELARALKDGTYATEAGAAGSDPEEAARQVPAIGHSLHTGQGGADIGHACARADIRSRPATGAVRLQAGTERPWRGKARPPPLVRAAP